MSTLVKYQSTYYLYRCSYQVEHFCIETSIIERLDTDYARTFDKQLANDVKEIKSTNKIIIPADKTHNLNKVEKKDYKKYLRDNVPEAYKKSTNLEVSRP